MNEFIYETETDSDLENSFVVASGGEVREGWIGSFGLADANSHI